MKFVKHDGFCFFFFLLHNFSSFKNQRKEKQKIKRLGSRTLSVTLKIEDLKKFLQKRPAKDKPKTIVESAKINRDFQSV